MGHITLGISDIEFVPSDEFILDVDDLIVIESRPARPARPVTASRRTVTHIPKPRQAVRRPAPSFDDAPTQVRAMPRFAHAR